MAFPGAQAVKVEARQPGKISEFRWAGNRAADHCSGKGAAQHPDTGPNESKLDVLSDLVISIAQ